MKHSKNVEMIIGNLLRSGVILSAGVTFIGGVIYLLTNRHNADYKVFLGAKDELRGFQGIMNGVFSLDGAAIIQFGVILLILTPVVRVIFSIFAFLKERDYTYTVITLIVLAVLVYSLSGGHI